MDRRTHDPNAITQKSRTHYIVSQYILYYDNDKCLHGVILIILNNTKFHYTKKAELIYL